MEMTPWGIVEIPWIDLSPARRPSLLVVTSLPDALVLPMGAACVYWEQRSRHAAPDSGRSCPWQDLAHQPR